MVKLNLKKRDLVSLYENGTYGARIDGFKGVLEMLEMNLNDLEMPPKPVFISVQYLRETKSELDSPKEMLLPETMERSS
ncbi:hypothetical protein Godav_003274 [Gossypium davidsonii]|uniref:Uncharacterized protein n=2 Tax=Gossypium TaxID=3633 RepID=A0A7J8SZM5_GOSDV|nr:hypothetical protein [Gossypium davidsonii]MBA0666970.1 hypothetical protein [Gossypium klotzschianum]